MTSDTIAAIATPPGIGGIGVIKISGPCAIRIAGRLFRRSRAPQNQYRSGSSLQSHRLYHGFVVDPGDDVVLDEVLLSVMKAPRSYTGEDVAEIQAHSGRAVLENILTLILQQGARLAGAGEFTRRAFVNGRIDLTQAEAVMDAIHAGNEVALRAAANQLNGSLRQRIEKVRHILADLQAEFEAAIDFPDEADDADPGRIESLLAAHAIGPLRELARRHETLQVYRDGLRLVIVGRPNVGKSSLMNALLHRQRSIVTPQPGTTRDFVQEPLLLQGIPFQLIDTAGLHASDDPIERIGIEKARECIAAADRLLMVVDAGQPLTEADHRIYAYCRGKPVILVQNKIDLVAPEGAEFPGWEWELPTVQTSALLGSGIEELESLLVTEALGSIRPPEEYALIPNLRHRMAMETVLTSLDRLCTGLRRGETIDLLSLDLQEALDGTDEILGDRIDGELLDRIFARFCIGK